MCTVGSNFNKVTESGMKRANYSIPVAIAKAVAKSPNVQRYDKEIINLLN